MYICCIKVHEQAVILKNPPKILQGFQNFPESRASKGPFINYVMHLGGGEAVRDGVMNCDGGGRGVGSIVM